MMEENKKNMMELNEEQLEAVAGGRMIKDSKTRKNKPCPCTSPDQKHNYVKTGKHREVDFLPFGIGGWTRGEDEYRCTICNGTLWSKGQP